MFLTTFLGLIWYIMIDSWLCDDTEISKEDLSLIEIKTSTYSWLSCCNPIVDSLYTPLYQYCIRHLWIEVRWSRLYLKTRSLVCTRVKWRDYKKIWVQIPWGFYDPADYFDKTHTKHVLLNFNSKNVYVIMITHTCKIKWILPAFAIQSTIVQWIFQFLTSCESDMY